MKKVVFSVRQAEDGSKVIESSETLRKLMEKSDSSTWVFPYFGDNEYDQERQEELLSCLGLMLIMKGVNEFKIVSDEEEVA